jgi:Transposase DDE domain
MILPTPQTARRKLPTRRRGTKPRSGIRPPVPAEPSTLTDLTVSILPAQVAAFLEVVPPGLPLEALAPIILRRTPLANAILSLWAYLLQPATLDGIFARYRGPSYEDVLSFPTFVELIRDALVLHRGSGNQSFQRAKEQNRLPTTERAVYGKLERIPISLSVGFFEEVTERIRKILPIGHQANPIPSSLADMTITILDGKQIKRVAKRLKPLRGRPGKVVGGKILAAYLPAEGLAVAMAAVPDGEANDIRLMPEAIPQARARITGVRLWVVDRQFCDLNQPALLSEQGDHFLIRRSLKIGFLADPERSAETSVDAQGRTVIERWGWLGSEKDKRRRYVRHIHLSRPGEEDVMLVTDLVDGQRYPAADLLAVYLSRWGIERVYQEITEVFELQQLIGCTAEASIFQAGFCLLLYNLLQVVRAYIAASQRDMPVDSVSTEQIFEDVKREVTALTVLFPSQKIAEWFTEELSHDELVARLTTLLAGVWTPRYRKAKNKKPRRKVKTAKCSGAHTSVYKVLEADRLGRLKSGASP